MDRNTPAKSTTLVLILTDGSHRVTQWNQEDLTKFRIEITP